MSFSSTLIYSVKCKSEIFEKISSPRVNSLEFIAFPLWSSRRHGHTQRKKQTDSWTEEDEADHHMISAAEAPSARESTDMM